MVLTFDRAAFAIRKVWRENALSIVAFALFFVSLAGQALAGRAVYNDDAREHGRAVVSLGEYLTNGAFVESVFENWESEFLQMALFVVLTIHLRQKGSSESKKLEGEEDVDEDPREHRDDPHAPWAVRQGGVVLAIYQRSLSIALFALFAASFVLHAIGGMKAHNEEQLRHGAETASLLAYATSSKFWFESFQNWQSEFLSVAALVVLSIVLRQKGSPQSKPVAKPHSETA